MSATSKTFKHLPRVATAGDGRRFSRGWIVVRRPWRFPFQSVRFLWMWIRLKRELDGRPGLLSFEYRLAFRPLRIGMYIVWRSAEAEAEFYRNSSHQAISRWSVGSRLTPAMRLDHFVFDPPRGIVAVGGFRAFEAEGDLPAELDLEQLLP